MLQNSMSAGRARARLTAMKEVQNTTNSKPERIPNPTPPDNNKHWEDGHNKLSSKGD